MTPVDEDPDGGDRDDSTEAVEALVETIRSVLESLSEIEEEEGGRRHSGGRIDRGSTTVDYQLDVSVGLDDVLDETDDGDRGETEPKRTIELDADAVEPSYVVRVYESDDTVRVVADLPGINEGDVDASLADGGDRLELSVEGKVVESVPLRWGATTMTDVSFTNQILEITLRKNDDTE
ncbi:MAG: HSP20 family molecular chaperone IbpA [Halobacteriales archaeon]|jgi:HSP20 family molecular chaperone IbpA